MGGSSGFESEEGAVDECVDVAGRVSVRTTLADYDAVEVRAIPPHRALGLDCGCWLGNQHNLGIVFGDEIAVIAVDTMKQPSAPGNLKKIPMLLEQVAKDTGLSIGVLHRGSLAPYFSNESTSEWYATSPGPADAIIFVPDLHIGLRDAADDFYLGAGAGKGIDAAHVALPTGQSDPAEFNMDLLLQVLSAFRKRVDRIVQVGDFLDIWEAEEALYEQEHSWSLAQMDPYVAKSEIVKASRVRNALLSRRAESAIRQRWGNKLSSLECLFTHRVRGNHDFDGSIKSDCWHFPLRASDAASPSMGADLHVRVEHGHRYDAFNRTYEKLSDPKDSSERAEACFGREVTWDYAKKERKSDRDAEYGLIASLGSGFSVNDMRHRMDQAVKSTVPCVRWSKEYKDMLKPFPRVWVIGHTHVPRVWSIPIEDAAWCSRSRL